MKRFSILLVFFGLCIACHALTVKGLFNKFKDHTDVIYTETIKPDIYIESVFCDNPKVMKKVRKECNKIMSKYHFEILSGLAVGDGDDIQTVAGVYDENGKDLNMLMFSINDEDFIICTLIQGNINIETLTQDLISKLCGIDIKKLNP